MEILFMVKEEKLKPSDVDMSFISKDSRFDNLTGKIFGDLKILGSYKKEGNTLKWVAECSCGNVVKTSRTKLYNRGKVCCVECAELKLRDKHFTPMEVKKADFINKRPDLTLLNIHGETWADEWSVTCNTCKESYSRRYRDLIKGVKACSCKNLSRKALDDKEPKVKDYCERFGFQFMGWDLKGRIKLKLYCPKHNKELNPLYDNVEKNKISCSCCKKEYYKPYNLKSQEDFIKDAISVHGVGTFDYSEVNYINSSTKVKIKCNNCGEFNEQTPAGHLSGRGCKSCAKTGYKPNEPCWIYLMKLEGLCELWYKIGITSDLKTRLYNVGLDSWYDITYIDFKWLDKGWKAKTIEGYILEELTTKDTIDKRYQKEGTTEIFQPIELPLVEELLEDYYTNYRYLNN